MIVYETTDIVKVKIDSVTFGISPLSFLTKAKIQAQVLEGNAMGAAITALKCGIKTVEGLKKKDGSSYNLNIVNDELTDKSIDDLMNINLSQKLITVCMNLINGMPEKQFLDKDGNPIEGVKFVEGDEKN